MLRRFALILSLYLAPWAAPTVRAEETVDSVQEKVLGLLEKQKSMKADMAVVAELQEEDFSMKSTKHGTYEQMTKDDKVLYRQELTTKGVETYQGEAEEFAQTETIVCDGDYLYTLTEQMGEPTATKQKVTPARRGGIDLATFKWLRLQYDLKLLPDARIGDELTYVIEAKPKKEDSALPERTVYYFSQKSGNLVSRVIEETEGKVSETTTFTKIQANPEIGPERFRFEPPGGVIVEDRSPR